MSENYFTTTKKYDIKINKFCIQILSIYFTIIVASLQIFTNLNSLTGRKGRIKKYFLV